MRQRDLDAVGAKLAAEAGLPYVKAEANETVADLYRQRLTLASGRVAMIDNGLGFQLVPWSPSLEKQRGRQVSGIARDDGRIDWELRDWELGRKRRLGL